VKVGSANSIPVTARVRGALTDFQYPYYNAPVSTRAYSRRSTVRRRRALLGVLAALLAVGVVLAVWGGGSSGPSRPGPTTTSGVTPTSITPTTPTTRPTGPPFAVGTITFTLSEPATPGVPARSLPTTVRYPAQGAAGGADQPLASPLHSGGPYPLVVFSEGFAISPESYALLLDAWAAAGYVVADPTYPFTAPTSPGGLVESDIVHHPADLSFVITSLLDDDAARGTTLSGLIDASEVGVIGHSDGGEVSLAAATNTCCRDSRIKAAAILSGAELAAFQGTYVSTSSVPLLVVQGTDDPSYNPPSCSIELYNDAAQPKYYLSMIGQTHTSAYLVAGQPLDVVAQVTIDFLDGYLRHSAEGLSAMTGDGTVPGLATLTSADSLGPPPGSCPVAPSA
jgi:dienelactone hydrolase